MTKVRLYLTDVHTSRIDEIIDIDNNHAFENVFQQKLLNAMTCFVFNSFGMLFLDIGNLISSKKTNKVQQRIFGQSNAFLGDCG